MEKEVKSSIIQITPNYYPDLASEVTKKPMHISKSTSWTAEYQKSHNDRHSVDQVIVGKSDIRVFNNPLVSLKLRKSIENQQNLKRTVSLDIDPIQRNLFPESVEMASNISGCTEIAITRDCTFFPIDKQIPKFNKQNNKPDLLEINELSMSPVMKKKISKVSPNQTIFKRFLTIWRKSFGPN